MTREQAIEHGKEQLEIFGGEHKEFIECAIDTMRKYQKIQEIIDDYEGEGWERIAVSEIREVIEDGANSD